MPQIQIKHLSTRLFRPQTLVLSQSTPFEVIGEFNQTRVRYYAATEKSFREPFDFVLRQGTLSVSSCFTNYTKD